jgi:nucleoid-associated protein YgaU
MRKEVKIALVLVLIGVVVFAIYFFSNSEKTIEVASTKPLTPQMAPPEPAVITPSTPAPSDIVQAPKVEEPVAITPPVKTESPSPATEKPATPGSSKVVWTIDLEPLTNAPTTKPARMTERSRQARVAQMESAANKVIPNQPISLEPEFGAVKPEATKTGTDANKVDTTALASTSQKTHVVKTGETLYQIAKEYYGRGDKWTLIVKANPKLSPTKVRVGDKLIIPAAETVGKPSSSAIDKSFVPAASETVGKPSSTIDKSKTDGVKTGKNVTTTTTSGKKRTYKVRYGDTLQVIAQDQLGSSARWKEILRLNKKLKNDPMKLKSGMILVLPEK